MEDTVSDAPQGVEEPRTEAPLVSIVCVLLNAAGPARPLLESIVANSDDNCELIVIDGGSTDGTTEVIEEFASHIDYWISEPDRGLYHAMNKGIAAARGEYILHVNAGDTLLHIPTAELRECLRDEIQVACFRVYHDDELFQPRTGFWMKIDNGWHHQGTFYRRVSHPGYDESYPVFSDMNANQLMFRAGYRVRMFPGIVATHLHNGASAGKAHFGDVYRTIRLTFGAIYVPIAFCRFKYKGIRKRLKRLRKFLTGASAGAR